MPERPRRRTAPPVPCLRLPKTQPAKKTPPSSSSPSATSAIAPAAGVHHRRSDHRVSRASTSSRTPNTPPPSTSCSTAASGTSTFVELVGKFNVSDRYPELLSHRPEDSRANSSASMRCASLLDRERQADPARPGEQGRATLPPQRSQAIGNAAHTSRHCRCSCRSSTTPRHDLELRRQATRALGADQGRAPSSSSSWRRRSSSART